MLMQFNVCYCSVMHGNVVLCNIEYIHILSLPFPSSRDLIIGIHEVGAAFAIIRGAFTTYIRGAFAIIRSGSSIKCGAFNIIRDHRCFHSTLFPYTFHGMYMI